MPDTIGGDLAVDEVVHPLAMIMTQDCDLDLDYKARHGDGGPHRLIDNVLFCDAGDAVQMRAQGGMNYERWNLVRTFQNERYHVLSGVYGWIGLDFRRIFTIPTVEIYRRVEIAEAVRLCFLTTTYRDHLSHRFYGYHMRVALPEP